MDDRDLRNLVVSTAPVSEKTIATHCWALDGLVVQLGVKVVVADTILISILPCPLDRLLIEASLVKPEGTPKVVAVPVTTEHTAITISLA